MHLTCIKPPARLPVSLHEAREACQLVYEGDDAHVMTLIRAAVDHLDGSDGILGRALMPQEWSVTVEGYAPALRLPLPPLRSVLSASMTLADGTTALVPVESLTVLGDNPGTVLFPGDLDYRGALLTTVTYSCGYDKIPDGLRYAVLALVRHWYDYPGTVSISNTAMHELPFTVSVLVQPYRVLQV